MSSAKENQVKLNKETLEALLGQKESLKGMKRDQMNNLYKLLDNKFCEEEYEEYEKLFNSFDPDQKNEMPVSQLGTALRILQQLPTDNEVLQLIETISPKKPEKEGQEGKGGAEKKAASSARKSTTPGGKKADGKAGEEKEPEATIDFYKFLLALGLYLRSPLEIADEIKTAFKVLDRSKQGYIMSADLREFLSQLGDCLTDEEINEMINMADTESNGKIHYEAFVDYMTNLKLSKKKGKGKKKKKKKK